MGVGITGASSCVGFPCGIAIEQYFQCCSPHPMQCNSKLVFSVLLHWQFCLWVLAKPLPGLIFDRQGGKGLSGNPDSYGEHTFNIMRRALPYIQPPTNHPSTFFTILSSDIANGNSPRNTHIPHYQPSLLSQKEPWQYSCLAIHNIGLFTWFSRHNFRTQ